MWADLSAQLAGYVAGLVEGEQSSVSVDASVGLGGKLPKLPVALSPLVGTLQAGQCIKT